MQKQNVLIYVYDANMQLLEALDEYTSFQFTKSWTGIGDWTINLGHNIPGMAFIKVDGIGSGIVSKVTEDVKASGKVFKLQGVELKGLAQKRIVMATEALSDKPCNIIASLLTNNLLSPTNANRAIPGTLTTVDVGEAIEYTAKYDVLSDALQELCEAYDLGYTADIVNGTIAWTIATGVNRTTEQNVNEVLIIGYDIDTLDASTIETSSDVKNTAIVAGEDNVVVVGDSNAGLARTELYVDARSDDDLQAKGTEALSAYGTTQVIDTTPSSALIERFINGEFALGDIGTFLGRDSARLCEVTYIFEGNSINVRFTFGYGVATISDALKAATSNYKSLLKSNTGGGGGSDWETVTPTGSTITVEAACKKKLVNGVVYLKGACRCSSIGSNATLEFLSDIGDSYTPAALSVLPLGGDVAGLLLYINTDGSVELRNRTGSARTDVWFRIDCSYAL